MPLTQSSQTLGSLTITMINNEFWIKRWAEGKTGFHQADVNPKLIEFAERFLDGKSKHAYVPLCGKTKDMLFLVEQGLKVSGSEVSSLAIKSFFSENKLSFEQDTGVYRSEKITLYAQDFFELNPGRETPVDFIYDRAAMVAMPHERHKAYAKHLLDILKPGGKILLISFDYDLTEMSGPPFALSEAVIRNCFETAQIEQLSERSILEDEPKFRDRGLSRLSEAVWQIEKAL